MHSALWISKTGLSAQDKQLTTLSNNLANASTVGFKRDRVIFEDLLYQIKRQPGAQSTQNTQLPSGLQLGTGVRAVGTQKEFTSGSLQVTDQSLDLAINGRGFFQIQRPNGEIAYTRNGQFQLSQENRVVDVNGFELLPAIDLPAGTDRVTVGKDGIVSAHIAGEVDEVQLGTITLVDFVNPSGLQAIGSNHFVQTPGSGAPIEAAPGTDGVGSIEQGMLEGSNVDIVREMVDLITTQRVYELNSKVVSAADEMLRFIAQNT